MYVFRKTLNSFIFLLCRFFILLAIYLTLSVKLYSLKGDYLWIQTIGRLFHYYSQLKFSQAVIAICAVNYKLHGQNLRWFGKKAWLLESITLHTQNDISTAPENSETGSETALSFTWCKYILGASSTPSGYLLPKSTGFKRKIHEMHFGILAEVVGEVELLLGRQRWSSFRQTKRPRLIWPRAWRNYIRSIHMLVTHLPPEVKSKRKPYIENIKS